MSFCSSICPCLSVCAPHAHTGDKCWVSSTIIHLVLWLLVWFWFWDRVFHQLSWPASSVYLPFFSLLTPYYHTKLLYWGSLTSRPYDCTPEPSLQPPDSFLTSVNYGYKSPFNTYISISLAPGFCFSYWLNTDSLKIKYLVCFGHMLWLSSKSKGEQASFFAG